MKKILNEIKPTIELIAAIILGIILIPIGIFWSFGKLIYDIIKSKLSIFESFLKFYKYLINVILQILIVAAYLLGRLTIAFRMIFFELKFWAGLKSLENGLAISIDIFGNVTVGEFIEDLVTAEEDTYFGNGKFTISAATGYLEKKGLLNKRGIWFTNTLSFVFGDNHSINAYNFEINNA